jgi:hypothetical protein
MNVNGQSNEKVILLEENIEHYGPFWYQVSCLKISCPGLMLEINDDLDSYSEENEHVLEWGGVLNENSTIILSSNSGTSIEDISIQMIKVSQHSVVEEEELIDSVPSPGNQGNYYTVVTSDVCTLGNCDQEIEEIQRKIEFVGILDNYSDKDSIRIAGNPGDVIEISEVTGNQDVKIEIWYRNNQEKELVDNNLLNNDNYFIEYPENSELWLRINSNSNQELYPYKFTIYRNNQSLEAPLGGELNSPWNHGEALTHHNSWFYESYIAESDTNGDSLLFKLGSDTEVGLQCSSGNIEMKYEILLFSYNGDIKNITQEDENCPDTIYSDEDTISVEFRIRSNDTGRWNISFTPLRPLDAGELSDAPESRWLDEPDSRWGVLGLNSEITGSFHSGDNVDIYVIKILDTNGSRIYLNEVIKAEVNYTIQEIDQGTGLLVNTSNGETIVLPYGNHALRIERRASIEVEVDYIFKLEYLGEYEKPEVLDYQDLSWMFDNFYILMGILFLTPLMIVIFWNRGVILRGEKVANKIQVHEMKRLRRIRHRLSEQLKEEELKDEGIINLALKQLGESPWHSINEVWGKPILSHLTEQIEICAWKISENKENLLLGIKVGNMDWKLAAIRINFPEGKKLAIKDVSPKHLFQEDEIFLDTMKKNSQIFIRVSMEEGAANLGLQLSGLVNGEPLAAVPNKTIDW